MARLRVLEIFDSLQGEGYWTGTPMTFVRLAGCNAPELGLGCVRWCDTRESWDRAGGEELGTVEIMSRAWLPRLCLTGGEPMLQMAGVMELVTEAHRGEIRVHLETNGTVEPLEGARDGFDWTVVSPKPPDYMVARGWDGRVDELKLVVDDRVDAATAERVAASHPEAIVSIQPKYGAGRAGERRVAGRDASTGRHIRPSRASAERAVALVMAHPDWRLSLQTHKLLGIR
jgi:7-carboxy-7-deazaguanine synthase